MANLAGVPFEVVQRAEVVSKQFAQQFKEKLELKQKKNASAKMPLNLQADWVYLMKLASGETEPGDKTRDREVLERLKDVVQSFARHKKAMQNGSVPV